jgi:hypothetical protein
MRDLPGGLDQTVLGSVARQLGYSMVLNVQSESGGVSISRIAVGGLFVRGQVNVSVVLPDLTIAASSSSPLLPWRL